MSVSRKFFLAAALLLLALASGCSSFYDGEYSYVTKHEEQGTLIDSTEQYYEVHTYVGMKNVVQSLISSAAETGTIRATDYSGSVQEDISRACLDATRDYPLGAYAVDYISQSVSRILGYDEVNLRISYRLSAEEMALVRSAITLGDLYGILENAEISGQEHLAVQISSLSVTEQNLRNYLLAFYRSHPEELISEPRASISFYPSEDSVSKIVDFRFSYQRDWEESQTMLAEMEPIADEMIRPWKELTQQEQAFYACLSLSQSIQHTDRGNTAYDVFLLSSGDSEGCAMAFQYLCNRCGIDCQVVEGRAEGRAQYWNIIRLEGDYYHVDAYACIGRPISDGFLFTDSQMIQKYWWDYDKYPSCSGPITTQSIVDLILMRQTADSIEELDAAEPTFDEG